MEYFAEYTQQQRSLGHNTILNGVLYVSPTMVILSLKALNRGKRTIPLPTSQCQN